jgi:flagellar basal body-associated protein FliL
MSILKKVFYFYLDGFQNMKLGKSLWLLIAIKIFILFAVIKWIFFPNYLETHFQNDTERSHYILNQLTKEN